eukprot:gene39113-48306_t
MLDSLAGVQALVEALEVRFGHPSGTLRVGAEAALVNGQWKVTKALMSRSARILMEGWSSAPLGVVVSSGRTPNACDATPGQGHFAGTCERCPKPRSTYS